MTQQTEPTLDELISKYTSLRDNELRKMHTWPEFYPLKSTALLRYEATIAHLQRLKAMDERAALWAKKNTFRPNGGFDDDGAYD